MSSIWASETTVRPRRASRLSFLSCRLLLLPCEAVQDHHGSKVVPIPNYPQEATIFQVTFPSFPSRIPNHVPPLGPITGRVANQNLFFSVSPEWHTPLRVSMIIIPPGPRPRLDETLPLSAAHSGRFSLFEQDVENETGSVLFPIPWTTLKLQLHVRW